MLPEINKIKAVQLKTETPASSRSETQPRWGCELRAVRVTTTTQQRQSLQKTWFSTQCFAELPWEETKSTEKHAQETTSEKNKNQCKSLLSININESWNNRAFIFLGLNTLCDSTDVSILMKIKYTLGSGINFYEQVPFSEQEEYCKVFPGGDLLDLLAVWQKNVCMFVKNSISCYNQ